MVGKEHSTLANLDPALFKWAKWVIILLATRRPKPFAWASFIALNPPLRKVLTRYAKHEKSFIRDPDSPTIRRRIAKCANLVSSILLFIATADNNKFPKDYLSIYLWINYYGALNPPSASSILVSPHTSPFFKLKHYKSEWLAKLYNNKEYIVYPLIFAQILSNYLTPTRFKLNQRYLSSSIKSYILNPIWINYSLGATSHSFNKVGLLKNYLLHTLAVFGFIALTNFKARFLDRYYELKHNLYPIQTETVQGIVKNYLLYAFHTGNSIVNMIYSSNILSMLLITISSPMLSYLARPTSPSNFMQNFYMRHTKDFFKLYVKVIGATAGFITIYLNSLDLIPDTGYKSTAYEDSLEDSLHNLRESTNVRRISKQFFDALNLYLFRLILLSKWRITKENHPNFKVLSAQTWNRIEGLLMSYGIWKVMNLNDFVRWNENPENFRQCARLKHETLVKLVDRVM